jgi:hypothetical protein
MVEVLGENRAYYASFRCCDHRRCGKTKRFDVTRSDQWGENPRCDCGRDMRQTSEMREEDTRE